MESVGIARAETTVLVWLLRGTKRTRWLVRAHEVAEAREVLFLLYGHEPTSTLPVEVSFHPSGRTIFTGSIAEFLMRPPLQPPQQAA